MSAFPDRPGLQPERTALAWQRTAITATVAMVPLVVVHARLGLWFTAVLGSAATTVGGVLVLGVHRRLSELREQPRDGHGPFSPFGPMVGVGAVTGLAASVGILTALVVVRR